MLFCSYEESNCERILNEDALVIVSENEITDVIHEKNVSLKVYDDTKKTVKINIYSKVTDGRKLGHAPRIKFITPDGDYVYAISPIGEPTQKHKDTNVDKTNNNAYKAMAGVIGNLSCRELYGFHYGEISAYEAETSVETEYNAFLKLNKKDRDKILADNEKDLKLNPIKSKKDDNN